MNEFSRTELLLGVEGVNRLKSANVAVFGIGGVGSFTVDALIRSGLGKISIIDDDVVSISNINRQLIATSKTIGKPKVEVMRDRILEINPNAQVKIYQTFYTLDNADTFDLSSYSYIVDAIDTVSSKLVLIQRAKLENIPIISCMGAGNKLDPTRFEVSDIYDTSVCPLARIMRSELRKRCIDSLKVLYSKEPPLRPVKWGQEPCTETEIYTREKRQIPGSVSFVPSVAGLIIAGEVIKDIVGRK